MLADERPRSRLNLALTLLAAGLFLAVGSMHLGAQGAYYDELHQATASFVWTGNKVDFYSRGEVAGIPLFNMTYSGAIKSHLYGAWLWGTGSPFSIESWRWLGLLLGASGIVLFGALTARVLCWRRLAVMLTFVVTDATLLLGCRHDWGPIALAFLLRMTMLGLCLRPAQRGQTWPPLLLGFLLGFAVYEKVSSIVTVVPVLVLYFAAVERRSLRTCLCLVAGGAAGALPVILWNVVWLLDTGRLASTEQSGDPAVHSWGTFWSLLVDCAVMPAGDRVRWFIFDLRAAGWMQVLEGTFVVLALALATLTGRGLSRLCVFGAAFTVLAVFALPSRTWVHHWVLLTPWQYLAVVLAICVGRAGRLLRWVLAAWLVLRVATLVSVITLLSDGGAGWRWSPDMHRLQAFAAVCGERDLFVAGDWGVGTQVLCAAQGRRGAVVECFDGRPWPDFERFDRLFLLGWQPLLEVRPPAFDRLREHVEALRTWRAVECPTELQDLRDLQIRCYVRVE